METIDKQYIVDEQNRRIAVQIPIETFEKLEEILENYDLVQLMEENEGEETLSIPAGTQTGSVFRLRDKGVPHVRGGGRGDQVVLINVAVPTDLNPEQRELLAQLGKTLGREVVPQGERRLVDRIRDALGLQ